MGLRQKHLLSRRHFCLCCMTGAAFTTTGGWLTPRQAFAEARGLVTLIKDSAASSPVTAYKLRGNVSVLKGSGGNIAVLTGPDGKVLIDGGIGVSRPQLTKTLSGLGGEPVTHLINTHWHFDHTDGGFTRSAQRSSPTRTPASISLGSSASRIGITIFCPHRRARFPARSSAQTAHSNSMPHP